MADTPSRIRPALPAIFRVGSSTGARSATASQPESAQRRERLREFQTGLSEKLRRAQSAPLTVNRLGLQIGPHRLLVDLADAGEILAVPEIAPVPLTKPWYRGLANVRGNLLGIVDLSLFAGGPPTPIDKESRVLAFSSDLHFSTGILASRMLGLRSAADLAVRAADAAPPIPSRFGAPVASDLFAPWLRARLVDAHDVHWMELDLSALVADERFVDIARG